jgi:hypothetical protein
MSKILFSPVEFRSIASVGVAASKDDVTPVIMSINISNENSEITAVATDRYRIARSMFTLTIDQTESLGDFNITIPSDAVTKFWNSIKVQALKGNIPIELEVTAGDVQQCWTLSYDGITASGAEVRGSFPPVDRLLDIDMNNYTGVPKVGLKPGFLADLSKLFAATDYAKVGKDLAWTFHFGNSENDKPMPVYVTRNPERDSSSVIEYLVQPNLILR